MSIKEIAYGILDNLNEEQLKGFIMMFRGVSGMEIVMEERYLNYIAGRSETSLLHDMIMRGIW